MDICGSSWFWLFQWLIFKLYYHLDPAVVGPSRNQKSEFLNPVVKLPCT